MTEKQPKRRAVRPKLAASLLLIRQGPNGPQILMGRRAGGHKFMPNKYVFPGGRVERADAHAPIAAPLPPITRSALEKHLPAHRAAALAAAAIRETFEETGIMLARPLAGRKRKNRSPWRDFHAQNLGADLEHVQLVARAITPPYHGRRFDTWFFTAPATHVIDLPQFCASGELEDVHYIPLDKARTLDVPKITSVILDELDRQRRQNHFSPHCFSMRYGRHISRPIL